MRVTQLVVQPSGDVAIDLEFRTGACPQREELETTAAETARALDGATGATVRSALARPQSFMGAKAPASLARVGALVGVSSCKGGVGKSTVAVNLAFALAAMGGRVGLLDADVHGPSLPSLVSLPAGTLPLEQRAKSKLLRPARVGGVALMSYGFIAKGAAAGEAGAAVMRGPLVGKAPPS